MSIESLQSYKPYKCPICRWVHAAVPYSEVADENHESFFTCFNCGAPTINFVPAKDNDAPVGVNLQRVVVPGSY